MSLTNPNTPVSQQDLKDFYDKIKPYMGLYPSAMGKKVGKGDIYSTEERLIGQWIDGKPLYQRSFSTTVSDTLNTNKIIWTATGCDYKEVKDVSIKRSDEDSWFGITESGGVTVWFTENSNHVAELVVRNTADARKNAPIYISVRYTKTADSAISIGDETDYSTREKIVGTWIDGKPLYQKTITGTLPAITQQEMYDNALKRAWFSIGASIDSVIDVKGFAYIKENDASHALESPIVMTPLTNNLITKDGNVVFSQGQGIMVFTNRDGDHPNTLRVENHNYFFSDMPFMATLQYTKTTD